MSAVNGALLRRTRPASCPGPTTTPCGCGTSATGRQIGPAMTTMMSVNGALLSRDETRILSWSADKTLRLWDVATGRQIGPAMTHDDSSGARC